MKTYILSEHGLGSSAYVVRCESKEKLIELVARYKYQQYASIHKRELKESIGSFISDVKIMIDKGEATIIEPLENEVHEFCE